MEAFSLSTLFLILTILIIISAFFSGAETAMMAINRYQLRHLVRKKHKTAILVSKMLEHSDRVLSVILIGNNCGNIFAGSIATIIAIHFWGRYSIAIATLTTTIVILVVAEILPKTIAASYPRPIAFLCARPLWIFLKIFYPIVIFANSIVSSIMHLFRLKVRKTSFEPLSADELTTLLHESEGKISSQYQKMLISVLNLDSITVDDIMIPRKDIVCIDLEDDWEQILHQITHSEYTRLPVCEGDINRIQGILHLRDVLDFLRQNQFNKETLIASLREAYFVPDGSPLHIQLLNFRSTKKRMGLVVDEYGDIQGLITIEDILEEIVGEFTTSLTGFNQPVRIESDGSYLVSGGANIRDLNRAMNWDFDSSGPKTLSGLIIEYLETIPQSGICLNLSDYPIEILKMKNNKVELVKIYQKHSHGLKSEK